MNKSNSTLSLPRYILFFGVILCCFFANAASAVQLNAHSLNGDISTTSWKAMRDAHVTKQNLDYSCGAASLATLLDEFYGLSLTETEILKDMNKQDSMANFEDMALVVNHYGFKAGGFALNYDQLTKLAVPVIVYLQYRGEDHFSVLRGISESHVQLADPSWGNRIFSKYQFLKMWETRDKEKLKGKILLVLPKEPEQFVRNYDFFVPPSPSLLGVEMLTRQRNILP